MADYTLEGPRWGGGSLGTFGGAITWAMDGSVPSFFSRVIASAFADWTSHANIQFNQAASAGAAEIVFSDAYIDGSDGVLGETSYSSTTSQQFTSASIELDSSENWHTAGSAVVSADGTRLFNVLLHEIGHAIGLDHYDAAAAIMNSIYNSSLSDLAQSDIDGIQALYGPARTVVAAATPANVSQADPVLIAQHPLFGYVANDFSTAGGQIVALYEGLLGRAPDPLELESFTAAAGAGSPLSSLAQTLLGSGEYSKAHGNVDALSNAAFVTQLYATVLGRAPDGTSVAAWAGALDAGTTRPVLAVDFALSAEHAADLHSVLGQGVFVTNADDASVARLYYGLLDRAPDQAGLAAWEGAVAQGLPLSNLAQAFLGSQEYAATHAGQSTTQFVTSLYEGALGRAPDTSGLAGWVGALNAGMSQVAVAVSISEGTEAKNHLLPSIETGFRLA